MNEATFDDTHTIHEMTEFGRQKLAQAQSGAKSTLAAAIGYTRRNPWVAIGGAALLGGALVALARSGKTKTRRAVVRNWLDEAYAKLPTQEQVQSVVETSGLPDFLGQLKKKLHLD